MVKVIFLHRKIGRIPIQKMFNAIMNTSFAPTDPVYNPYTETFTWNLISNSTAYVYSIRFRKGMWAFYKNEQRLFSTANPTELGPFIKTHELISK